MVYGVIETSSGHPLSIWTSYIGRVESLTWLRHHPQRVKLLGVHEELILEHLNTLYKSTVLQYLCTIVMRIKRVQRNAYP